MKADLSPVLANPVLGVNPQSYHQKLSLFCESGPRSGNFMVGVNISHSYFHPGGAHITWVKIISAGTTSPMPEHKGFKLQ